ncbi:DNA mismatch repair protein msh3 [Rhizoctonia solani]|uniref:MutS protein homolog 3 n=1 Tax=Rhizoctonia solani TaxID=456999 RepID=A0A0K6G2J8_9AGAM|nr:DNA mismatch repair protein msh3 [Rhizoctonia solani]
MSITSKGRVLVTGINGFIGLQVARVLNERGYTIVGAVRHESKTAQLRKLLPQAIANGSLTFGVVPDITKSDAFDEILSSKGPFDAVIHAGSPISHGLEDVERDIYQPAIEGTLGILRSIKAHAPSVKRVIITSSFVAIVDRSKGARPGYTYSEKDWSPVTREQGLENIWAGYTASKILAEKAAWNFVETEKPNFTITTLCPPFTYGPADQATSTHNLNESVAQIYAFFEVHHLPNWGMASGQRIISSYFSQSSQSSSKPKASGSGVSNGKPIDLTVSDSEPETQEPPSKKTRLQDDEESTQDTRVPSSSSPPPADSLFSSTMSQRWSFTPVTSGPSKPKSSTAKSGVADVQLQAFRKKMGGDAPVMLGKKTQGRKRPRPRELAELEAVSDEGAGEQDDEDEGNKSDEETEGISSHLSKFAGAKRLKTNSGSKGKASTSKAAPTTTEKRKGSKKAEEIGPAGLKYTPLEKQANTCFRFFGEDARVASKELGIACFMDKNFLTASIPVHRRDVHVKKLISQGYKASRTIVGIIGQMETAALKKAGDNRSAPFDRQLTHLYTAATFIDEIGSAEDDDVFVGGAAPPIACIIEELRGGMGADDLVHFSFVAVTPATGDIVYDTFDDTYMRSEIETRMAHVRPLELLLPESKLTKPSEKILAHIANQGSRIRFDRYKNQMSYTEAFELVSAFYRKHGNDSPENASEGFKSGKLMGCVVDFPKNVGEFLLVSTAADNKVTHIEVFLKTEFFMSFMNRSHMLVSGNSLHNLEIFRNQTDFTETGSLVWVLNKTKTKFGSRMLRSWIGRPLVDRKILQERVDAVEEIMETKELKVERLQLLLKGLPDLVKGLCRIQYKKATPSELATMLTAWQRIATALDPITTPQDAGFESDLLNDIAYSLPTLREPLAAIMSQIDLPQARDNNKAELWVDSEKYPGIDEAKFGILSVESELEDHLKEIRNTLKKPSAKYISVSGIDYLIEVRNGDTKKVPVSWQRVNSTKAVTRFHTPEVKAKLHEREVFKETLAVEANKAFNHFLGEVAEYYSILRNVTMKLAVLDCLSALAVVAQQPGYVKPEFYDDDRLDVDGGRHPMVEALRVDPFVPVSLLAQIGSYVPCRSAKLGMLDGIATRMGASDEITRGRSTFMVEISETAEIIKTVTPRTLVILDELGRGTSTFDGMAIAHAVMQHLIENTKCKTLFITHYPMVALDLEQRYTDVSCHHMGYVEQTLPSGESTISFTYKLSPGMARSSFGIECGRLAHMPEEVLQAAKRHAARMQEIVETRRAANRFVSSCFISSCAE